MRKTVKYIFIFLFAAATLTFLLEGYKSYLDLFRELLSSCGWLLIISLALYLIVFGIKISMTENFLHEITHMLFSIITFNRVNSFYVSRASGAIDTTGDRKILLVILAPYFFPLLTVLFLILFSISVCEYDRYIVAVSYSVFLFAFPKHLLNSMINDPTEIVEMGPSGWILLLLLNFWVSWMILSWYDSKTLGFNEALTLTTNGINKILLWVETICN